MKKARLIAGMTAAIPAAVGGFAAPAAAHAAQATATLAHQAPAKGKTVMRHDVQAATTGGPGWYSLSFGETLYFRNGGSHFLPAGWSVFVTCYYKGNTGNPDPYWDHISAYRLLGITSVQAVGHIADRHVNLNGLPPNAGIPKCLSLYEAALSSHVAGRGALFPVYLREPGGAVRRPGGSGGLGLGHHRFGRGLGGRDRRTAGPLGSVPVRPAQVLRPGRIGVNDRRVPAVIDPASCPFTGCRELESADGGQWG